MIVDVIIPAYNEEHAIAHVVREIPKDIVRHIVVANNNSNDRTPQVAREAGAIVVDEPRAGYGSACLKGMEYIAGLEVHPDVIVFLDGDYSDYPEEMPMLIEPIAKGEAEIVIGSRARGQRESGSMTGPQIIGNWLSGNLLRIIYGVHYTDLGPFRAIRYDKLLEIGMKDKDYGWTVEMQVKAAKHKLKYTEVPVNYRRRIGTSKVSGTIKGSVLASQKILWTIFKYI